MKHRCGYPTCEVMVATHVWACNDHLFLLPNKLLERVIRAMDRGQVSAPLFSRGIANDLLEAENWCILHALQNGTIEEREQAAKLYVERYNRVHETLDFMREMA